jgi:hypothetical protein
MRNRQSITKAEVAKEGTFFREQISFLGIFVNKKVGNRKN